jgi:hypothetical protein
MSSVLQIEMCLPKKVCSSIVYKHLHILYTVLIEQSQATDAPSRPRLPPPHPPPCPLPLFGALKCLPFSVGRRCVMQVL